MRRFFLWEKRGKAKVALVLLICGGVNPLLQKVGLTPIPLWCLVPIAVVALVAVFIEQHWDLIKTLDDWDDEDDDFNMHG